MAFRIPPPKTPTDGTLLTSARKVADDWYQPPPPKQGPQWRLWVNLPAVELWQAITLSCDIEPKYYLGDADPEFQLRMRIAIGNGLGKGDRPHCALVTLTDVACLARRCGWTLPPEFPKPEPAPAHTDAEPASDAAQARGNMPRMVEWRKAIVINWSGIVARYGKGASALQVIAYLKERDISGCILPGGDDRELKWRPTKGPDKSVSEKTVLNALCDLERERLIIRVIPT